MSERNPYSIVTQTAAYVAWESAHQYDDHIDRVWRLGGWEQRAWEQAEEERRAPQREKVRLRNDRRAAWITGVARIMAEVRRREAERAVPEPPFFTSDNPLDGERLWS